jgi:glycosyltransferase involved in cell wall biosynthesis
VRVAWVIYGEIGQPTGGYTYDRIVVDALRAGGDAVEVLAVEPDRTRDAAASREVDLIAERIDAARADVVVGDALCVRELGGAFERLVSGVRRALLVHHFTSWEMEGPASQVLRVAETRAVFASDLLVTTGRVTAARLSSDYPGRAVTVVVPGADRLPRLPRDRPSGGPVALLFVGSIVARKRLPMLLDAMEAIEATGGPRLSLTIVGDPRREPDHAASLAGRVGRSDALRDAVAFAGVVDEPALSGHLKRADALVLPSSLEGYGMVLTEAVHAGLPVIVARPAARAAGLAEGGAALVFDDAAGLAEALRRFAGDPGLRLTMGRAADLTALPRWVDATRAFRDALGRLASRGSSGASIVGE